MGLYFSVHGLKPDFDDVNFANGPYATKFACHEKKNSKSAISQTQLEKFQTKPTHICMHVHSEISFFF